MRVIVAGRTRDVISALTNVVSSNVFNVPGNATVVIAVDETGETSEEEFTKKVGADFTLDVDGDIERLDLSVSGTYEEFKTREAIVTKNSNDVLTYYYQNGNNWSKGSYDYEKELESLEKVLERLA